MWNVAIDIAKAASLFVWKATINGNTMTVTDFSGIESAWTKQ